VGGPRVLLPRAHRVSSGFGPRGLTIECGCRGGLDVHGLASPFLENHGSLYEDRYHARWKLRDAFHGVFSGHEVPEVAAYNHSVILTGTYVAYSTHVPGASAGFSARFRDTLASYVVYMFERKLSTYFSCQDCLDRYPCHVDCMVDYLNEQYDLLENGFVDSLETYRESMNRSADDAVRTETYMSVARAAADVMSAEEYLDGGTVAASVREPLYPVRPPIPLYPLPEGTTMRSDGLLVGSDGVVQGSDEDMSSAWEDECARMQSDKSAASGPVIHGPDPRMASHLMP
jgi:hypothetical protein